MRITIEQSAVCGSFDTKLLRVNAQPLGVLFDGPQSRASKADLLVWGCPNRAAVPFHSGLSAHPDRKAALANSTLVLSVTSRGTGEQTSMLTRDVSHLPIKINALPFRP